MELVQGSAARQDKAVRPDSALLVRFSRHLLSDLAEGLRQLSHKEYQNCYDDEKPSVGKQVRHIIEFYREYFRHLSSPSALPLCYDDRQRDPILETSPSSALAEIEIIKEKLAAASQEVLDITLSAIVHPEYPAQLIRSTSQRELMYLFDHTVHHMALIKMLAELWGVHLCKDFGLAPSTMAHENSR
jgi:uncharacterized damage-inducible protein DinB